MTNGDFPPIAPTESLVMRFMRPVAVSLNCSALCGAGGRGVSLIIGNMQLIHHLLMHPRHPGMHIAIFC